MASPRPRRRRLLLPTVLAAVLAVEVTGLAIARTIAGVDASPTAAVSTAAGRVSPASPVPGGSLLDVADRARDLSPTPTVAGGSRLVAASTRAPLAPGPTKAKTSHASSATKASVAPRATAFHGRNHVWIPSLRISAAIQSFPCSRSRPPDAGVYRWGCAGRNNVYLLGHAWSTFKPLHDAYVGGRLRAGMKVWYADGSGRVHEYSVAWWRVVAPTSAASWAWAAQTRPSMTLQTCVGANSQYRLMVRLFQIH